GLQNRKVVGLAKKRGQVGRQRVDEIFPFRRSRLAFQLIEIARKILPTQRAQAAGQPAIDHFTLVLAQRNAGALVDHAPHSREIGVAELELPFRLERSTGGWTAHSVTTARPVRPARAGARHRPRAARSTAARALRALR